MLVVKSLPEWNHLTFHVRLPGTTERAQGDEDPGSDRGLCTWLHFFYYHCRAPLPVVCHFQGSPGKISLVRTLKEFCWKRRIEIIFLHSFRIGQFTTLRIYLGMPTLYPTIFPLIPLLCRSFLSINIAKAPTWSPPSSAFSDYSCQNVSSPMDCSIYQGLSCST